MYIRKKKNPSDVISVQIIDKSSGKYKVIKTIGSSKSINEVSKLIIQGKEWIKQHLGIIEIDFENTKQQTQKVLNNVEQLYV